MNYNACAKAWALVYFVCRVFHYLSDGFSRCPTLIFFIPSTAGQSRTKQTSQKMKMKSLLLVAFATLGLTTAAMAQVPNYVPTNGLVGWWPFNGNANDESGNGNNGTVNGVSLTSDRFGNINKAYNFVQGNTINIINNPSIDNLNLASVNLWFKTNTTSNSQLFKKGNSLSLSSGEQISIQLNYNNGINGFFSAKYNSNCVAGNGWFNCSDNSISLNNNNWHMMTAVIDSDSLKYFVDGVFISGIVVPNNNMDVCNSGGISLGKNWNSDPDYYTGIMDDIGFWNRALTQQEITNLYTSTNCANNTAITPPTNSLTTGSTATFNATTSDPNPAYVWQSNFGQGFQTLNNVGNYSGTNTGTLNIANVQLPNHTQPIRVISTSGNCIDTSNVAVINILDTCITSVTVYDTLLTTVTDTLVINATLTGLNPPVNQNTLKVFPNPARTHITIDYGNVSLMSGYTLKIVNALGATVFSAPINQQTSFINLSTWTGNGIYFVQLINPQNNTIENRKIVIQ